MHLHSNDSMPGTVQIFMKFTIAKQLSVKPPKPNIMKIRQEI